MPARPLMAVPLEGELGRKRREKTRRGSRSLPDSASAACRDDGLRGRSTEGERCEHQKGRPMSLRRAPEPDPRRVGSAPSSGSEPEVDDDQWKAGGDEHLCGEHGIADLPGADPEDPLELGAGRGELRGIELIAVIDESRRFAGARGGGECGEGDCKPSRRAPGGQLDHLSAWEASAEELVEGREGGEELLAAMPFAEGLDQLGATGKR